MIGVLFHVMRPIAVVHVRCHGEKILLKLQLWTQVFASNEVIVGTKLLDLFLYLHHAAHIAHVELWGGVVR